MKAVVLQTCIDKETGKQLKQGDVVDFTEERIKAAPKFLKAIKTKKAKA